MGCTLASSDPLCHCDEHGWASRGGPWGLPLDCVRSGTRTAKCPEKAYCSLRSMMPPFPSGCVPRPCCNNIASDGSAVVCTIARCELHRRVGLPTTAAGVITFDDPLPSPWVLHATQHLQIFVTAVSSYPNNITVGNVSVTVLVSGGLTSYDRQSGASSNSARIDSGTFGDVPSASVQQLSRWVTRVELFSWSSCI